ncbi:hypothetical protein GCM10027578_27660 [Spirosoma luteolum]
MLDSRTHVLVCVLLGPRQVSTTTLAQMIRPQLLTTSLYLDLQRTTDAEMLQSASSSLSQTVDRYVIIDEVQRKPNLPEGAYLLYRLRIYFPNVTKRLVKSPKHYLCDSGMLHRRARIRSAEELATHILVGASWKGYVLEQLRRTAFETEFYYYRTHTGAECDLVIILPNGQRACVEIKFADIPKLSRGFYESVRDSQPTFPYVLVLQGHTYTTTEGVTVCPLPDFLQTVWPAWLTN